MAAKRKEARKLNRARNSKSVAFRRIYLYYYYYANLVSEGLTTLEVVEGS